ncbi:MAG: two-component system, chemotaxis family, protein-glutamate methylesterase/glutaminase [Verrucomicrobiota bacterium]
MPASHESPAGTAPSVLLVEEYDALAAAISSALKKFAPRHYIRAVESLTEAEAAAGEISPQLFIIDFDPPRSEAAEFLERMRMAHPHARLLALASGIPLEFAKERYGPNAIHFVEKPFELADFGAAVQALLGPWTKATSGDSRGTLRDLNLRDLVPLECLNMATAVFKIKSDEGAGEIHFHNGQICHAAAPNSSGTGALHELLRWTNSRVEENARAIDAPRTIQASWQPVFLEALRKTKPKPEETKARPPSVSKSVTAPPAAGKKILVIDDTEMLLIFVEDALATADSTLQIVTAFTGGEGVRRAEVMVPDLVLLDYSLPDLPGDQVCARLLENEATARIPVLMMSGHVPEMLAAAEKYENVVATIAKPFLSEALVALVTQTLSKGPLVAFQKKETPATPAPPDPKPTRQGNGRKPVKTEAAKKEPPLPVSTPSSSPEIAKPAEAPPPPLPREVRPAEPALYEVPQPPPAPPSPPKLATANGSAVMLGLGMEVISVQLTPRFRIDTIRAKPTASTLSLTPSSASGSAENLLAGFEIGSVELDPRGLIKTMRVVPTRRPANSIQPRNGFAINDLALVNENASIEVTAKTGAAMSMQLVAMFKVAAVELSERFEVAQLVLQPQGNRVRVSLDPKSRGLGGTEFETIEVRLDASARIAELVLNSAVA